MSKKRLVVYSRTHGCGFVKIAKRVLEDCGIAYSEVLIDCDENARRKVVEWTGFESVPTLVVVAEGQIDPIEVPLPLEKGHSPRGINRGSLLTEPNEQELKQWLRQHNLL